MKRLRVMVGAMSCSREVNRLAIEVGQRYEVFCQRYEAAVPAVDGEQLAERLSAGADWVQIVADAATGAPHGFLRYWKFEATALMALAGNRWQGVEYLIGNHTVLEQMYRYDPCALLYGPLRTVIYVGPDERTRLAFDQPSTCFSSFADADIARIGIEIDRKLARLLTSLDVPVGSLLDPAD